MFSIKELRFIFIARVVIPLSTFGKFTTCPPAPLGFSKKGRNPSAGIELKTCLLLYYKMRTYKVPVCCFTNMIMSGFF